MNTYWSNEDDKKVSYITERPPSDSGADGAGRMPDAGSAPPQSDAFTYPQRLNPRNSNAGADSPRPAQIQYGTDRSSFISKGTDTRQRRAREFAMTEDDRQTRESFAYSDGYQVHSEHPQDSGDGGKRGNFWLKFLIVLLVLAVIGGGAYLFRYEILDLVGKVFGEEVAWKIMPTPTPTETVPAAPAYVSTVKMEAKPQAMEEISAVTGDLELTADSVTEQNIVLTSQNSEGTRDYYLFAYDTGRLLGYYEGLSELFPCGQNVFYIADAPYLITARGFPLADLDALQRSAGSEVTIYPMINGWAMVSGSRGAMLNFVGEDGMLLSSLWFAKAFPFTGDTSLAYVDTGNLTDENARYALYLLGRDGETKRLYYVGDTDGVMDSVCDLAFMANGEVRAQDEALTTVMVTDDAAAYVNCGALVLRDPDTGLYGLFVNGVQQYPFSFDSIEPMPSDLQWISQENGYVTRYAVASREYPLPRSYSFVLRRGDTVQMISMAAVSVYPIVFN